MLLTDKNALLQTKQISLTSYNSPLLQYDIPSPDLSNSKCVNIIGYLIRAGALYLLSLIPLCDLIADIGTIILFFNSSESNTIFQLLSVVSLISIFLSMRSYVILFVVAVENYSSKIFPDSSFIANILFVIPLIGSLISNLFIYDKNKQPTKFTFYGLCAWFGLELLSIVSIISTPFLMICIILRNYKRITKETFVKFKSLQLQINQPNDEWANICNVHKSVIDERKKYYIQVTLLKLSEFVFEDIPQLILQSYVFMIFNDVYNDTCAQTLYVLSISFKFLATLRIIYNICEDYDRFNIVFKS